MGKFQITAVRKPDRNSTVEHITHVKIADEVFQRASIINWIDTNEHQFFTRVGPYESKVVTASRLGIKYIKTENDGTVTDNLLSLPAC